MKKIGSWAGPLTAVLLVILLGIRHLADVRAGAGQSGSLWMEGRYFLLASGVAAALAVCGILLFFKKAAWEWRFLAAVLSFGSLYLAVLPPLSAPDEISHFMSAYEISNRLLGLPGTDEEGYVLIRRADDFLQNIYGASGDEEHISLGRLLNQETYEILHEKSEEIFADPGERELMPSVYRSVNTTPLAYLPQALGITAARIFHFNGVILAFCCRFFNLGFFAAMGFLAVRFLPFGKPVLTGTAMLPMSLHLAASCSYDAFVMGLSFFFGSYCLYLAFAKPAVQKRDILVLSAVMAALGPCKIIYTVVMGFALLIPVNKFGTRKKWLISAGTVLAVFLAAMVLVNSGTIASYASGSDAYVSWAEEESYSIPLILHQPVRYLNLLYNTAAVQGEEWYLTMMGARLGNLDPVLSVPFAVIAAMTVCLVLMSVRKAGEALYLTGIQKAWILFLTAGCLLGLMTAMLVAWTPLSSQVIEGVQGRYLIPLLPFVLMTIKSDRLVKTAGNDETLFFYMCAMNGYALLRLFGIVSMRL